MSGIILRISRVLGRHRRQIRSLFSMLLGMVLGVGVLAFVSAGEIYDYQDTFDGVHLPRVDAIVCLAGGRGRIAAAGDLWYRYWELAQNPPPVIAGDGASAGTGSGSGSGPAAEAEEVWPTRPPVFYVAGMGPQSNWNVLARQVRRGVLDVLKPEHVVIEKESENTDGNARWLARLARERGWSSILLVTSRYHMRRARYIFGRVLAGQEKPVRIETMSVYQEPFEPGEWRHGVHGIRVTMGEYLKWIYYKAFWLP